MCKFEHLIACSFVLTMLRTVLNKIAQTSRDFKNVEGYFVSKEVIVDMSETRIYLQGDNFQEWGES